MLTSQEFADEIGVSVSTVKRMHKRGTLVPALQTPTGRRQYTEKQVKEYLRKGEYENEVQRV